MCRVEAETRSESLARESSARIIGSLNDTETRESHHTIRRNQYSPREPKYNQSIRLAGLPGMRGYPSKLLTSRTLTFLISETDSDVPACQFYSRIRRTDVGIIYQSKLHKCANGLLIRSSLRYVRIFCILIRIYMKGPHVL